MTEQDLQRTLANGENSGTEFKRDDVRPEQLAKEIVALANFRGGRILLGVDDDGSVSGLTRPDVERWVMDVVFGRYVHPTILPYYQEVVIEGGRKIAIVDIEAGVSKPYVVRHNGREDVYIRVGSTSRLATREQQVRLAASGALLHPEALAIAGTRLDDFATERVTDYLVGSLRDDGPPPDQAAWHERLLGLGLMAEGGNGPPTASLAGLVLFGRRPRRALPQAGIRWMAFAGPDKDYRALDDVLLDGPMVALRRGEGLTGRELIEPGLIERALDRMQPFVSVEDDTVGMSLRRGRRWLYPVEALREAMLNAMIHRDWTRLPEVEVVAYSDRLEITSPGSLPNAMTLQKVLAGQRSPRNPILVDVMRDYGYVDARGMGVRRKIVPLTRQSAGEDARFEVEEDYFRVILPAARTPSAGSTAM